MFVGWARGGGGVAENEVGGIKSGGRLPTF